MTHRKGVKSGIPPKALAVGRRTFLVGSGSVVAAGAVDIAGAQDMLAVAPEPDRIVLQLSADGRQAIVYEAYTDNNGAVKPICSIDRILRINAASFGPDATFVLGRPFGEDATKHIIYVDNASAGNARGLRESILLQRSDKRAAWNISFESFLWGAARRFGPKPLREFMAGAMLETKIGGGAFAKAMRDVSGGRLSGGGKSAWKASLDARFKLQLTNEVGGLSAFCGRLKGITTLEMGWDLDIPTAKRSADTVKTKKPEDYCGFVDIDRNSAAIFRIQSVNVTSTRLSFADAQKRRVTLSDKLPIRGSFVLLHRPEKGNATAPIAIFKIDDSNLEVSRSDEAGTGLSALRVRDILLVETRQETPRTSSTVRLVITGNVAQKEPIECRTAAGILLLSEPYADTVPASPAGDADPMSVVTDADETSSKSKAKNSLSVIVDAKGRSTMDASAAAFDRYLALLVKERPFDDAASFYVAAVMPDRHDAAPVDLQFVQIRTTLHAADAGLEGAEWSRLRFGVPPDAMVRTINPGSQQDAAPVSAPLPTEGTPLELIYPMSDGPRSAGNSVVALLPERGLTRARISMTRAKLDAGVGGALVDLSFAFRGLSLVFSSFGAELLPDNTACGVIQTPVGDVIDTRPVVILELPPSAIFEEAWFRPLQITNADQRLTVTFERAEKVIVKRRPKYFPDPPAQAVEPTVDIARQREGDAESADPFYAMWREFFRKEREFEGEPTDYYSPSNREHLSENAKKPIDDIAAALRRRFVDIVQKPPIPPNSMRAHLGGRSRLSFRLNCSAVSEEIGRLKGLAFSLEALTNLGRHEPAVTRRAEVLVRTRPDGVVPPIASATLDNIEGTDILAFQGIKGGPRTVFAHMDAVRDALARTPEAHETALELVPRLVFSTSQRAIYLTDAVSPGDVFSPDPSDGASDYLIDPPPSCEGDALHRLWSVRLVTHSQIGPQPSDVRVVATPDFRPEALRPWPTGPRGELNGAPPYGNAAPWMIPRAAAGELEEPKLSLFQKLQGMLSGEAAEKKRAREFRAGLSANDRHQLLLLTSAYGLPVIGKRQSDEAGKWGALIKDSDQFEPGQKYLLGELDAGHAIYAPRTLNVEEMSLSALGATFRHHTVFNPPLPALLRENRGAPKMFDGRPAFDGLSVEKWDHRSHQGRDDYDGVSYKGYLMPSGHRATIEKRTSKEIIPTQDGGLRAISIQRMYIKVTDPVLRFKRLEQPYGGRCWLDGPLTVAVPLEGEIADPYDVAGGRIQDIDVGLAFWPTRLASTEPLQFTIKAGGGSAQAPLLFVDNVAAGDPEILSKLADIYNDGQGNDETRRTWSFGRAKLRYAHGRKEGDTDLTTTKIIVRATGRNNVPRPLDTWTGANKKFDFTPALEGDGKPPFFPAIERAA